MPAQAAVLADAYEAYRALLPDTSEVRRGLAAGRGVAAEILRKRANDGYDAVVPWAQPSGELGRVDSARRTAAQTETVQFWAENTFTQWSRALRGLAAARGLGTVAAARMLGLAHVAVADALIGCFDAKYHFVFWRPVHAIARAGTDGNPATTADPSWRSLLVVNHPEYPSAHAAFTGAVTAALTSYFGTTRVPAAMTSTVTGTTRTYRSLTEPAHEVVGARIWAGLHFRTSMRDGAELGRRVARMVI